MVKRNNGKISVLAYGKPMYIDYAYYGDFASVTEFRYVLLIRSARILFTDI